MLRTASGRLRRQFKRAARALRRLWRQFFCLGDCEKFAYIPKEYMAAPPSSGGIGYRSGEGVVMEWRGDHWLDLCSKEWV